MKQAIAAIVLSGIMVLPLSAQHATPALQHAAMVTGYIASTAAAVQTNAQTDVARSTAPQPTTAAPHKVPAPFHRKVIDRQALTFVPTAGTGSAAVFFARSQGISLRLEPAGLTVQEQQRPLASGERDADGAAVHSTGNRSPNPAAFESTTAHIDFLGANPEARIEGLDPVAAYANFFVGTNPANWRSHVTEYRRVRYKNLYPGIDLIYYGCKGNQLEYDLVVSPGANPSLIRLRVADSRETHLDDGGNLPLDGKDGGISLGRPMLYQNLDEGKRTIAGEFVQVARNEFAFKVERYDHRRPLIIDPTINLLYSTYMGGALDDEGNDIVLDAQGNSYIVGSSESDDFPVSSNAYQTTIGGGNKGRYDATVSKFNSSGNLLYSTYIGGSGNDYGYGIAIDALGNAYITGQTASTDFPTTSNAYATTPGGAFLSEISPDGSTLEYSTYYSANTSIKIAFNMQGQIVIGGTTGPGLPTTTGSYMPTLATGNAAYAAIFDLTKTGTQQLIAATYYGTSSPMQNGTVGNTENDLALDPTGDIWIGGRAYTSNLPTTANAFQSTVAVSSTTCCSGQLNSAAYFAELSSNLSQLIYATYFSGKTNGGEYANGEWLSHLDFDSVGNLYATGGTSSPYFPVTAGSFQTAFLTRQGCYITEGCGGTSGWAAKFAVNTQAPAWAGFIGGNGGDTKFSGAGHGIAIDSLGDTWIGGETQGGTNFPTTSNAYQPTQDIVGIFNGFASEISPDGSTLLYSTFLGGSGGNDYVNALAIDPNSNVYLVGGTNSGNFPITANAIQSVYSNGFCPDCSGDDEFFAILGSGTIGVVGPVSGGDTGDTTMTIDGSGFASGATCSLVQGTTTIASSLASVNAAGTAITCTFPLNGATTGSYNVVVNNPNGTAFTQQDGFTVQSGGQPDLTVSIVGRKVIRTGYPSTFYINVTNSGNENAYLVPLWITFPYDLTFTFGEDSQQDSALFGFNDGTTGYANFLIPFITPGQTLSIPLQITSASDSTGIPLTASLQPPWFVRAADANAAIDASTYSSDCVTDPTNSYTLNCMGPYFLAIGNSEMFFTPAAGTMTSSSERSSVKAHDDSSTCSPATEVTTQTPEQQGKAAGTADGQLGQRNKTHNPYPYNQFWPFPTDSPGVQWAGGYEMGYSLGSGWANGAQKPQALGTPEHALFLSEHASPSPESRQEDTIVGATCPAPPPNLQPSATANPSSASSNDPNYKSGSSGDNSTSAYVRGTTALNYIVGFENQASAAFPADLVVVTDQLDPTKVNLSTVSLGTISFGSSVITLPSGTNTYATTYTPTGVTNYVVRIQGSLNSATGLLKWTFQTIDPTTGLPPTDPTVGFLPPDADGIEGQGSVQFSVVPDAGQSTGTQITNAATVVFDTNAPLTTPAWLNTLDVTPPTSSATALPFYEVTTGQTAAFTVNWSGTDTGSGIASYNIYVSDTGGPFTLWQNAVTATSATYTGILGHTYGFYSIATDGAGNVEAAKSEADTSTTVSAPLASMTTLTASSSSIASGSSVTLTATVTPPSGTTVVATGTVTFLSGTTSLGTAPLDGTGVATYSTTALPVGTDSVIAQYGGDSTFAGSTSAAVSVIVGTPAFSLSLSPGSISIAGGGSGSTTIAVTPAFGFGSTISFSCSGLPAYASCTFSPPTVTPSGSAASTTTLTIATNVATASLSKDLPGPGSNGGAPLLCIVSLGVIGFLRARKRGRRLVNLRDRWSLSTLAVLLLALTGGALAGCGGGGPSTRTPAGTSAVTITASGGGQTQTATLAVTIQ